MGRIGAGYRLSGQAEFDTRLLTGYLARWRKFGLRYHIRPGRTLNLTSGRLLDIGNLVSDITAAPTEFYIRPLTEYLVRLSEIWPQISYPAWMNTQFDIRSHT